MAWQSQHLFLYTAPCLSLWYSLSLTFVSKHRKVVIGFWATRMLYGCGMRAIVSEVPFVYDIIAVVTVEELGLL